MESRKLKILKDVLGRYRISNQEHLFLCPYCEHHKRKFSVNIEKNVYKCWVCDTRGLDVYQVIRKHGSFEDVREWRVLTNKVELNGFENMFGEPEEVKEEKIPLPEEFITLTDNKLPLSARSATNYLRKRGVTKEDILRWKIGYCREGEYKNRIIVPSFSMTGNELYVDWDKDIILVEGAFDAIRAYTIGTSIPLLGSTLRVESKLFQQIVRHGSKVYLALDNDAERKSSSIASNLMKYGVDTYTLDTGGYEDVAEMPRGVLEQRKEQATVMNTNNYLLQRVRSL